MVAAPRMDLINLDAPVEESLHQVIDTGHSRFPVFEGERDNLVGILLAKDLLKLQRAPSLNIRTLLRPPVFVPESKGLNDLLREFRNTRNHMALVVDEFGRIAGLITIEDVLEQIVGDIEDEFDSQEDVGDIFALADQTYRVSGDASLERVGEAFGTHLEVTAAEQSEDTNFDTIGGFIAHAMEKSDLVFLEQVQDAIVVLLDHIVLTGQHLGHVHLHVFDADAVICKMVVGMVEMLRRLQQCFRRNTAHIGAGAAGRRAAGCIFPLVNTSDLETELGRTDGCDVTTGATANDDDVKLF
jgi:CBS domain-containing protein